MTSIPTIGFNSQWTLQKIHEKQVCKVVYAVG